MEPLAEYPVVVERTVSWGQMDAFGHVNNIQFFRFFEDARMAYFEAMGIPMPGNPDAEQTVGQTVGPILADASCKFYAPVTYPDTLRIGARVSEVGESRFTIEYEIVSESLGRAAAGGDSMVVSYDYADGRKVPVPDDWNAAIAELEHG